jgi:hypothetical protein
MLLDLRGDVGPVGGLHVGRVDGRVELYMLNEVVEHLNLRYVVDEMIEIERAQRFCRGVFNHADSAACVED